MLYSLYEMQSDLMEPVRLWASAANGWIGALPSFVKSNGSLRRLSATYEVLANTRITHHRAPFGIESVSVGVKECRVEEEVLMERPFGTLLRFAKEGVTGQPKVLLVSPMASHFATLLRETIRTMLPEHDVYVTDWHNARDVPLTEGRFDLSGYIQYLIDFLGKIGPDAHVVAICQPCVAALAATALMSEDDDPEVPASLTLIAGPIDTRINPTKVNEFAVSHPLEWFERNLIYTVPDRYRGAGRKVYPGFLQLAGFMRLNPKRHFDAFGRMHEHIATCAREEAEVIRNFYDEYFAVCDLSADFYLQTMKKVFIEHHLPKGAFDWCGRPVRLDQITKTRLLTVEGERDDICGLGQTAAALTLCNALPRAKKAAYVQKDAGHYGVFSGKRWQGEVYPAVREHIRGPDAKPPQRKTKSEKPNI